MVYYDMLLQVNKQDQRYIFLTGTEREMSGLTKHLNKIPQYQYLPNYKGTPTPEVFLDRFSYQSRDIYYCSAGLWKEVTDWCTSNNHSINPLPQDVKLTNFNLSREGLRELVSSWDLNIKPRDYQIDAAWLILKYKNSLSELATRAGKTLIFYIVARAAMELLGVRKILMIVPSIHLVKQGVEDLQDYKEFFETEQIWAGGESVSTSNLTIGTFQSLVLKADPRSKKYDPEYFNDYDFVCVDECHKLPCKSIKTILERFRDLKIKFGFTGTLPKTNTIEWLACQALMGPKVQTIEARELIEAGYLAEPIVKQFRIKYLPSADLHRATVRCAEYLIGNTVKKSNQPALLPADQRELTMVHVKELPVAVRQMQQLLTSERYEEELVNMCNELSQLLNLEQLIAQRSQYKIDLLKQVISGIKGNVLVFAHNVEYIKYISKRLEDTGREVYTITGSVTIKKRQKILDELLERNNCILVGSYGCVGTGLTFKNIAAGVFFQSFKSDIITRQSLGRLMLRQRDKEEFYLYDFIDVFPSKRLYNQGTTKVSSYRQQGFKHEVKNIEVPYKYIPIIYK